MFQNITDHQLIKLTLFQNLYFSITIYTFLLCVIESVVAFTLSFIIPYGALYGIQNTLLIIACLYLAWCYKDALFLVHCVIIFSYWPDTLISNVVLISSWLINALLIIIQRHNANTTILPPILLESKLLAFNSLSKRSMNEKPSENINILCFLNATLYGFVIHILCTYVSNWLAIIKIILFIKACFLVNKQRYMLPPCIAILHLFTNNFSLLLLLFYNALICVVIHPWLIDHLLIIKNFNISKDLLKLKEQAKDLPKAEVLRKGLNEKFSIDVNDIVDLKRSFIAGETKYIVIEYSSIYFKDHVEPKFNNIDQCFLKVSKVMKSSHFFSLFNIKYYLLEVRITKASSNTINVHFPRKLTLSIRFKCIPNKIDLNKTKISQLIVNEFHHIDVESESFLGRSLSVICTTSYLSFKLSFMDKFNNAVDLDPNDVIKHLKIMDDFNEILPYQIYDSKLISVNIKNCKLLRIYCSDKEISTIFIFNVTLPFSIQKEVEYIKATYHHININMLEYQKFTKDLHYGKRFIDRALESKSSVVHLSFENFKSIKVVKRSFLVFYKTLFHWNNLINFRHIDGNYCLAGTYNNMALLSFNDMSDLQHTAYLISNLIESRKENNYTIPIDELLRKTNVTLNFRSCNTINVDRNDIAKSKSELERAIDNKIDIRIQFRYENGIDYGGLTNEYFSMWNDLLFRKESGIFFALSPNSNTYHFATDDASETDITLSMGGRIKAAEFVGKYIGRLITHFCWKKEIFAPLPCLLSRALILHMLDIKPDTFCLQYDDIDTWKQTFAYILENDPESLELTFDVDVIDPITQKHLYSKSLLNCNKEVALKEDNKYVYLDILADWILNKSCEKQIKAFKKGLNKIVNLSKISLKETDLEMILCSINEINVDDLIQYSDFEECDQTTWLWETLRSFNKEEKSKFLQFVTGTSQLPMGSARNLYPRLKINVVPEDPDRLPTSQTCFNRLIIPNYRSYEELRKKLFQCIEDGYIGFGNA